jgi:hypothetical protein
MTSTVIELATKRRGRAAGSILQHADWLVYAGIVLCCLTDALVGLYRTDCDTVPYLDLSDAIAGHLWHSVVNAYWFPLYPALLALGKAVFGFRPQYEFMAARLVDAVIELFFVAAAVVLAESVRRLMLARGIKADILLPARTLYVWVAALAYLFASQDLNYEKPDGLVSSFMILTVAALLLAVAEDSLWSYVAVGLFGALAYWAKAFAFPFFFLWIFFAAAANLQNRRVLRRLGLSLVVFALIAGPYIGQISAAKGRFTFGESGRLDWAWYVNGADRFNPVGNPTAYQSGAAKAHLKHPGELLSKLPEISYYGGNQVYGSTPQWNDPSYWSDGLAPRFVLRQSVAEVKADLAFLAHLIPMRFQAVLLVAFLFGWGYRIRWSSFDPVLTMAFLLALTCIGLYTLVVLRGRFVAFAFVLMGTLYAASCLTEQFSGEHRSLHIAVVLMTGLILAGGFQNSMRAWNKAEESGARPLQGLYDLPVFSAGAALASRYPRGAEVACMGDLACWTDTYWAKYAGLKMTTIIETGHGVDEKDAAEGCHRIEQNPAVLDVLRKRNIRAIVFRFNGAAPCSAAWRPLGESADFFYLPL